MSLFTVLLIVLSTMPNVVQQRSMVDVPSPSSYVIVPGASMLVMSRFSIISRRSFASCSSCRTRGPPQKRWWRLKSPRAICSLGACSSNCALSTGRLLSRSVVFWGALYTLCMISSLSDVSGPPVRIFSVHRSLVCCLNCHALLSSLLLTALVYIWVAEVEDIFRWMMC